VTLADIDTNERLDALGTLHAWRPNRTRPGANGQPITRTIYAAVVQPDGKHSTRTYPLNRYDITPGPT